MSKVCAIQPGVDLATMYPPIVLGKAATRRVAKGIVFAMALLGA